MYAKKLDTGPQSKNANSIFANTNPGMNKHANITLFPPSPGTK